MKAIVARFENRRRLQPCKLITQLAGEVHACRSFGHAAREPAVEVALRGAW